MLAAANSQDNQITIYHTSDQYKVNLDFNFTEGPVEVRDIFVGSKSTNKILLTRDDEEFLVYEWDEKKDYKGKITHS
jgi:hypothetical protein